MRIILIISTLILLFTADLTGQIDFVSLDKRTYYYYLKGDIRNLKNTADTMLSSGIDYYYLRLRLGMAFYDRQNYPNALRHFSKALKFSSIDTISREYIYKSYLFSGRTGDANLYLGTLSDDNKNNYLKSLSISGISEISTGSTYTGYDVILYETNSLSYEAVKSSFSINAGFESFFLKRFKGTFAFTNLRKTGTEYSPSKPAGADLNFSQNQLYTRLTAFVFQGWEFSAFAHFAFYSETLPPRPLGMGGTTIIKTTEYLGGAGIAKNGGIFRMGANFAVSNFSNSRQLRGETYITFLPFGNLNLYLTSGGMYQTDNNWGGTYQINQEIGFRVFKPLWIEAGIINGNAFLYAREMGYIMNNSFLIPSITIYANFVILPGKKLSVTISPYYSGIQNYSWNLNNNTRSNMLNLNSFGVGVKLIYKYL
jgi:hypothetical protein